MSNTKLKQKQRRIINGREQIKIEPQNQEILNSIDSPNAWTPQKEDAWLNELCKLSARDIYVRFPPMRKPPNVSRRGRGSGWGGI